MKMICTALTLAILVTGCATPPPNTPGAGRGEKYTPIIDSQGVDASKYNADLADCRRYAGIIDRDKATFAGAMAGVIVMGAMAAMLGGNSRQIDQSAAAGGFAGMAGSENKAAEKQERIMINCMAGRGYRTLDGSVTTVVQQAPAAPAVIAQAAQPTAPIGQDSFTAERVAKDQQCSPQPVAKLAGKGPGYESYSVACTNGETLMLRCEYGNCRALK